MSNYSFLQFAYEDTQSGSVDLDNAPWNLYTYLAPDCTDGNITISMPQLVFDGFFVIINRVDTSSNTLTILPNAGETIAGTSSLDIPINTYTEIIESGNNWIAPRFTYN